MPLSTRLQTTAIFADGAKITEKITAGAEIFVVGYLVGIRQGRTTYPLVRRSIMASRIGEPLEEDILDPNKPKDPLGNRALVFQRRYTRLSQGRV